MALFLGGTALTLEGWRNWRASVSRRDWPTARGVKVSARLVRGCCVGAGRRSGGRAYYQPHVRYRYEVNGQLYEGSRFTFEDDKDTDRERMEARLRRYASGDTVAVRYNPQAPHESVLEVERPSRGLARLAIGLVLLAAAGLEYVISRDAHAHAAT